MKWKLIGVKDMLVPIAPTGMEKAMVAGEPAPKKLTAEESIIKAKGKVPRASRAYHLVAGRTCYPWL